MSNSKRAATFHPSSEQPPLDTRYSAGQVQDVAVILCQVTHEGACIPWGQARLLRNHSVAAIIALNTQDAADLLTEAEQGGKQ